MDRNLMTTADPAHSAAHIDVTGSDDHEIDTVQLRAMARASADRATRWASYKLPTVVPLRSYTDYTDASEKRARLAIERTKIEKELRKAVTDVSRGFAARHEDETDRQAQDILEGRPDEAFDGFEVLKSQIERLSQRVRAYAAAIRKQDEVVATIRSERSIDAAAAMASTHRAAIAGIADAISRLREAFDREEAARISVEQAGYDGRLPSFTTFWLFGNGRLDEISRRAHEYIG